MTCFYHIALYTLYISIHFRMHKVNIVRISSYPGIKLLSNNGPVTIWDRISSNLIPGVVLND